MTAQKIAQLREALDLSQTELAEKLGYHPSVVSRMEAGQRRPTPRFLQACAEARPGS